MHFVPATSLGGSEFRRAASEAKPTQPFQSRSRSHRIVSAALYPKPGGQVILLLPKRRRFAIQNYVLQVLSNHTFDSQIGQGPNSAFLYYVYYSRPERRPRDGGWELGWQSATAMEGIGR